MTDEQTHWRTYKTECDAHPQDHNNREKSEKLLFNDCEWSGAWEPFAAVSDGQWWAREGGNQHAWTVWRRPCCPVEAEE